ncbi:MAG: methanogen marker protein 4 [Methanobacteriota archaeon]|nr:MAG: methanogen marker protein 4 [Euryarchaeota archaeon]
MIDLDGLLATGCESTARIGIGVKGKALSQTTDALGRRGCRVELVGFDDPVSLCEDLRRGRLGAGVRGALSSLDTLEAVRSLFGVGTIMRTAFLATSTDKPFMLTPVGVDEGRTMAERLDLVRATVAYLEPTGWRPTIGVLSCGRWDDVGRGEHIRRSVEEGGDMVSRLSDEGLRARHHYILIEEAVEESDLVVAPDGIAGNLMFRALHFVGSGRALGAPVVNLPSVFVDTSRAKADYSESVLVAAGLAELGCGVKNRA